MKIEFSKFYLFLIFFLILIQSFTIFAQNAAYYSATVKDSTNQPIENVFVTAEGMLDSTYTDVDGKFLLKFSSSIFPIDLDTTFTFIRLYHPNYETFADSIMIIKGDTVSGPDIILRNITIATISGQVKYEDNTPSAHNKVFFYNVSLSKYYNTETDINGNYSIYVDAGLYYISTNLFYKANDYYGTYRTKFYNNKNSFSEADILEVNKHINNIDFTFPILQLGSISGMVRDAESQQPLTDVFISVATAEQNDSTFILTNQDGIYSIEVFEGNYILFAYHDDYYQKFYKDAYNIFDAIPVTVSPDSLNVIGIDFDLTKPEPGTNTIYGYVRDNSTYYPIPNTTIYAIPLNGENWIQSKSNYDGRFLLRDIKNGEYILFFYKEGYVSEFYNNVYEWENAFIFKLAGNENININDVFLVIMNSFGGEIIGNISSDSGLPLSGSLISAVNSQGNVISSSVSIHNGDFIIPSLENGSYKIKGSKIGYHTSEYSEPINIDLINNPVVDSINFVVNFTDIEKDKNIIPKHFLLSQNYPNPFNPITTIQYEIPKATNVSIKIYDVLGREIATLINNNYQQPGKYKIEWNAKDYSSGIYFYQIKADEFVSNKKMVLMR